MRSGTARAVLSAATVSALVLLGAGIAVAASPVSGSVSGPVVSVSGKTFKLKTSLSPTGSSTVHVGSATTITEQLAGSRADLKKGACVTAIGQKGAKSAIVATRIMLSQPVKGKCNTGFGPGRPQGGTPPQGAPRQQPPAGAGGGAGNGGFTNLGFANGAISAVKGSTLTVHDQSGSTSVTVSAKTQVTKTLRVGSSAIKVKLCAFVRGTSADKGVTVEAEDIGLSQPGATGCTARFRRP